MTNQSTIDKLIKISYEWKMYDAKINLIENGSEFEAKVDVISTIRNILRINFV